MPEQNPVIGSATRGLQAGHTLADASRTVVPGTAIAKPPRPKTAAQMAARLDADQEAVYHCLVHIASGDSSVKWVQADCADEDTFCKA